MFSVLLRFSGLDGGIVQVSLEAFGAFSNISLYEIKTIDAPVTVVSSLSGKIEVPFLPSCQNNQGDSGVERVLKKLLFC